jgi:general secretion pathway protein J
MRIGYQIQNGDLVRLIWPVLDPVATTNSTKRILLKNITHWQWQFLGSDNRFYPSWPATNAANQPLPKAIKITLTIRKWGTITRLFVVQNHVVSKDSRIVS